VTFTGHGNYSSYHSNKSVPFTIACAILVPPGEKCMDGLYMCVNPRVADPCPHLSRRLSKLQMINVISVLMELVNIQRVTSQIFPASRTRPRAGLFKCIIASHDSIQVFMSMEDHTRMTRRSTRLPSIPSKTSYWATSTEWNELPS